MIRLLSSKQANKQTSKQAGKQTSRQADKQTSRQADKQTSRKASISIATFRVVFACSTDTTQLVSCSKVKFHGSGGSCQDFWRFRRFRRNIFDDRSVSCRVNTDPLARVSTVSCHNTATLHGAIVRPSDRKVEQANG